MNNHVLKSTQRIVLVDALRGFALLGIMLLHSVEHFDFLRKPDVNLFFSSETDQWIMDTLMLLFSGKAYSIFALMFGFSFFIQMDRQQKNGVDFSMRFLWRLMILLILGFIHSLLYKGDILHMYAMLGVILVVAYRIRPNAVVILSLLLALQIPLLIQLSYSFLHPEYEYVKTFGKGLGKISKELYAFGTLTDVLKFNLWNGRIEVWAWSYYNGRYLQLIALFLIGMTLGQFRFFENIDDYKRRSIQVLVVSLILSVALYMFNLFLKDFELTKAQEKLLKILLKSYTDLAMTTVILSSFVVLHQKRLIDSAVQHLSYVGKLSLSNYICQAAVGVLFFYGFGVGMYKYMGATWSLMYGVLFFTFQVYLSKIWIKRYYYGPFEWLWRALTFFDFDIKFKK